MESMFNTQGEHQVMVVGWSTGEEYEDEEESRDRDT